MKKYIKSSNDDVMLNDTRMLMAEAMDVLNNVQNYDMNDRTWNATLAQIRKGCETIITKESNGTIKTGRN